MKALLNRDRSNVDDIGLIMVSVLAVVSILWTIS